MKILPISSHISVIASGLMLFAIVFCNPRQAATTPNAMGQQTETKTENLPKSIYWIVLGSGLALVLAGTCYFAKGAIYGLMEDESGFSMIMANVAQLKGKILIIVGVLCIIIASVWS